MVKGAVDCEEAGMFMEIIKEVLEFAVAPYPGDFLPILRWIDFGGYVKRIKKLAKKTDDFLQGLIDEHRHGVSSSDDQNTLIDRMLCLQESEPEYYTDETIKGLLLVFLVAGIETTSGVMEWVMSLLLNNPTALEKATSEIDIQVGQSRLINELDIPGLKYFQAVISETLRMFSIVPLLLPHMASQDCQIGGFDIPCGTMLVVNAWAIHMNPNLWNEPAECKPERFQSKGAALVSRVMGLALGSLVQCFEWNQVSDKKVDFTEGRGLTVTKAQPIEALCKSRPIMSKIL